MVASGDGTGPCVTALGLADKAARDRTPGAGAPGGGVVLGPGAGAPIGCGEG